MSVRPVASCLLALLIFNASPAFSADLSPEQSEQVKLKSGQWGVESQKADALVKAHKYQEAEVIYKKILDERQSLSLDLMPVYDSLGQLYLAWGKKEEAEKTYQDMVANREKMSGADSQDVVFPLQQYATCLDKEGKKDQAKNVRAKAAAIQKNVDSMPTFGKITLAAGSPERQQEADKMRALGEKWMKQSQQPKALLYFNRAVALAPNDPEALRGRADCLTFAEKYVQAQKDIDKAIKLKPDFQKAYVTRAFLRDNTKQYDSAMADFIKACTMDPKDVETMGTLAKHLDVKGKHKEAVEWYSKIIAVYPDLYWPYVQRATAYDGMGHYKEAIADYTTIVERAPEDGDYREYRAAVYLKAGELQKALDDYNKLISLSPKYPVGYSGRAKVYEKMDGKKSPRVVSDLATVKKMGY